MRLSRIRVLSIPRPYRPTTEREEFLGHCDIPEDTPCRAAAFFDRGDVWI